MKSMPQRSQHSAGSGPDATPFLITALKRKSRILRLGVIGALAEIQDPRSLSALVDRTKDESSEIRWQAAIALGELGDPMAAPALLDALPGQGRAHSAMHSAISLMKTGYHLVVDEDWSWSCPGMQEWDRLASLGKPALPSLINLMRDPDREVRRNAVHTLGDIGDRDAGPVLVKALGDEDRQVRWEAVMASEKCGVPPMQSPAGSLRTPAHKEKSPGCRFFEFPASRPRVRLSREMVGYHDLPDRYHRNGMAFQNHR